MHGIPEHLLPQIRRRKEYVNSVLARAEVVSTYQPSRTLWQRLEKGYYRPSPVMRLCRTTAIGEAWTSIAEPEPAARVILPQLAGALRASLGIGPHHPPIKDFNERREQRRRHRPALR